MAVPCGCQQGLQGCDQPWVGPLACRAAALLRAAVQRSLPLGTAPAGNANNTAPEHRQATTYRDAVHVDRKLFRGVLCYPLASLMLLVNNLHTHQQSSAQGSIGRCFFFTSPSILALFKMMLLLPERRLVGSPTELNDSLDVLCGLLELQAAQNEATEHLDRGDAETRPGHVQDYAVPDPPPHLAQPFADRALETDVRVLRVLSSDTRGALTRGAWPYATTCSAWWCSVGWRGPASRTHARLSSHEANRPHRRWQGAWSASRSSACD